MNLPGGARPQISEARRRRNTRRRQRPRQGAGRLPATRDFRERGFAALRASAVRCDEKDARAPAARFETSPPSSFTRSAAWSRCSPLRPPPPPTPAGGTWLGAPRRRTPGRVRPRGGTRRPPSAAVVTQDKASDVFRTRGEPPEGTTDALAERRGLRRPRWRPRRRSTLLKGGAAACERVQRLRDAATARIATL